MPSPKRLANTTIWACEEIVATCRQARRDWRRAAKRATDQLDAVQLAALAALSDHLAEIERLARDARQGKYQEK